MCVCVWACVCESTFELGDLHLFDLLQLAVALSVLVQLPVVVVPLGLVLVLQLVVLLLQVLVLVLVGYQSRVEVTEVQQRR